MIDKQLYVLGQVIAKQARLQYWSMLQVTAIERRRYAEDKLAKLTADDDQVQDELYLKKEIRDASLQLVTILEEASAITQQIAELMGE